MQRLYTIEFFFGSAAACGFTVVFLMSLLAFAPVASEIVLYVMIGLLALYLPLNLLLAFLNRRSRRLRLPSGVSAKIFERMSGISLLVAVGVLAYGFYMWPYAPIKPRGIDYLDKLGRTFTQPQYEAFRRWETAYISAWGTTMLSALLALPFYRSEVRRHVFEASRDDI